MSLNISEIFSTIQGEGRNAGRPCVFLRFSGCNLWRDKDIPSKTCPWCDTPQLHNGTDKTLEEVEDALALCQPSFDSGLVITGGEPLMQLTPHLLSRFAELYGWIDIETNGTQSLDPYEGIRSFYGGEDLCDINFSCSPKVDKFVFNADQYKILIPDKKQYIKKAIELVGPANVYLQPIEPKAGLQSDEYKKNLQETIDVAFFTGARVCIQQHKYLQVP